MSNGCDGRQRLSEQTSRGGEGEMENGNGVVGDDGPTVVPWNYSPKGALKQ